MPIRSSWWIVLFRSSISVLIFCLVVLSVNENGVLKSPTVIVEFTFSPVNSDSLALCILGLCF